MKTARIIFTAFIIFLASCKQKEAGTNSYLFNYEQAAGWSSLQLENGFAKSGKYCEKVTPDKVYSHTFVMSLAEAGAKSLKKVKASVWITAPELQQDINLTIDLFSPAENKSIKNIYKQIAVSDLQGKADWIKFTAELDIAEITDGSLITKVYVWNPGGQKFFLDDFLISFE